MESKSDGKKSSERAERLDDELDAHEANLGLPPPLQERARAEANRLLSLSSSDLSGMSAEECGEAAYLVEKFGLHIQRAYNRETARVRWAEESVRRMVGGALRHMPAYSYQERLIMAIAENDAARKVEEIRVAAQLRAERLSYLSARITSMSRALLELQQSKRGRHG